MSKIIPVMVHHETGEKAQAAGKKNQEYLKYCIAQAKKYNEKSFFKVKWCIEQVLKTMYNNTKISIISNYFSIDENLKPSLKFIIYTIVCKFNKKIN